nr:VWA domain-containing protein [Acidobacteriota bacterium]
MLSSPIKKIVSAFALLFALTVFTNAQKPTATPPEEEAERVFTEEIKLNVNASDVDGKFVADVKKEDLVIMEDGRIHQASSVRRVPANVLILMDTGGEMRAAKTFNQTRKTARSLINALKAEDSVAIMQYHDKVEIVAEWTTKENALKLLNGKANFGRRSVFFNALETATKFLKKSALDNRHLVLITDGTDSLNNLAEKDVAMKNLLTTDVNVHVVSYTQMELADIAPRAKGTSKIPPPK